MATATLVSQASPASAATKTRRGLDDRAQRNRPGPVQRREHVHLDVPDHRETPGHKLPAAVGHLRLQRRLCHSGSPWLSRRPIVRCAKLRARSCTDRHLIAFIIDRAAGILVVARRVDRSATVADGVGVAVSRGLLHAYTNGRTSAKRLAQGGCFGVANAAPATAPGSALF